MLCSLTRSRQRGESNVNIPAHFRRDIYYQTNNEIVYMSIKILSITAKYLSKMRKSPVQTYHKK